MEDHRQLLGSFVDALRAEAAEQRRQGGHPIALGEGRAVARGLDTATYVFDLHADVVLPEGVPVQLVVSGASHPAEVLYREGDRIYLLVETPSSELPPDIPHAELRAEPWFLHEQLAERLVELIVMLESGADLGAAGLLVDRMAGGGSAERTEGPPPQASALRASGAGLQPAAPAGAEAPLNEHQAEAVRRCAGEPLWFVWGPPGTGKTATLGRLVARLAAEDRSILVAAHANVALDAAVAAACRALGPGRLDGVVRVGTSALEEVRRLGVSSRDRALARRPDLAQKLARLEAELKRYEGSSGEKGGRGLREAADELRRTRDELREVEREITESAPLLFATLSKTAIAPEIFGRRFETVIVDEASMAYPPQIVFAASLAELRLAVFGDFRQLPPVVTAQAEEVRRLLGRDVFDLAGIVAAVEADVPCELTMLRAQYRMHPSIRRAVSEAAYFGRLTDGPGVAGRAAVLAQRPPFPARPLVAVQTNGMGAAGWRDGFRRSRWNPVSALWAVRFARQCADEGSSVAVLTPYRAQARLIGALVRALGDRDRIGVGTIHRYQGSERDAIVLDLVDARPLRVPGLIFAGDVGKRLMTVAVSRARGKLIALASEELLGTSGPVGEMLGNAWRTPGFEPEWSLSGTDAAIELFPDYRTALERLEADLRAGLVHAWLGRDTPSEVRSAAEAAAAGARTAPAGQAVVVAADVAWVFARRPQGWLAARAAAPRVVSAVGQILGLDVAGGRERGRRSARAQPSAGAYGLPLCACGTPMSLEAEGAGSYVVAVLACPSCRRGRAPAAGEVAAWVRIMEIRCPRCGELAVLRRGPWGDFFGCPRYPACRGQLRLRDVL